MCNVKGESTSQFEFKWTTVPASTCFMEPYVLSFTQNFIEVCSCRQPEFVYRVTISRQVRTSANGRLLQTIELSRCRFLSLYEADDIDQRALYIAFQVRVRLYGVWGGGGGCGRRLGVVGKLSLSRFRWRMVERAWKRSGLNRRCVLCVAVRIIRSLTLE